MVNLRQRWNDWLLFVLTKHLTQWFFHSPINPFLIVSSLISVADKPELVLDSKPEHHFLRAHCSLCAARFNLVGNMLAEKTTLRRMFDTHVREFHEPKKHEEC